MVFVQLEKYGIKKDRETLFWWKFQAIFKFVQLWSLVANIGITWTELNKGYSRYMVVIKVPLN